MYIHLGQDTVVSTDSIIGIFDIENTSVSRDTKAFFRGCEAAGGVINVCSQQDPLQVELPKSLIICGERGKTRIYISQISSATLRKRAGRYNRKTQPQGQ